MYRFQEINGNSDRLFRSIIIFLSILMTIAISAENERAQQVDDVRTVNCRAYNRQSTDLTNQMLDIERKSAIESRTGQVKAQRVVLSEMEAELKKVRTGGITADMQVDRRQTAEELGLKWDDRWNLDYVAYYTAIIAVQKRDVEKMDDEIRDLRNAVGKEPAISGDDLELKHRDLKKQVAVISSLMDKMKCGEVLDADRARDEVTIKAEQRKKFMADLAAFETRVYALSAPRDQIKEFVADAISLSNQARNAAALAGDMQTALANKLNSGNSQLMVNAVRNKCGLAQKSVSEDGQGLIEVRRKESLIESSLKDAAALAGNCSAKEQADAIQAKYTTSVRLMVEIGGFAKAAAQTAAQTKVSLERAKQDVLDTKPIIMAAQAEVDSILAERKKVTGFHETVRQNIGRAQSAQDNIRSRATALKPEYLQLRQGYVQLFPTDINDPIRLKVLGLGLYIDARIAEPFPNELRTYDDAIRAREAEIVVSVQKAELTLGSFQEAFCDVKIFDEAIAKADRAIDEIGQSVRNSSYELALAADLPKKAETCVNRAACQTLNGELRAAINANDTGRADGLIVRMNGMGCDTSALKGELDAKSERDAAALIDQSKQNCRFQQALDLASQIPASISEMSRVSRSIAEARAGLQAQQRIEQLIDNADKTNDISAATSYIAQARGIASPYPCLADMLKGSRSGTTSPAVEEIPEDRVADNRPSAKTKPDAREPSKVEELPEDRNDTPADTVKKKPGDSQQASKKPTSKPPVVEDIPDDGYSKPSNDRSTPKNRVGNEVPLTVADIPDDNESQVNPNKQAITNGKEAVTNAKEPKPKKTGPGFWEKLGKVAEAISEGIANSGIDQPPVDNTGGNNPAPPPYNPPPVENPPVSPPPQVPNGQSGGGDVDLSGLWERTQDSVIFRIDLRSAGKGQWSGKESVSNLGPAPAPNDDSLYAGYYRIFKAMDGASITIVSTGPGQFRSTTVISGKPSQSTGTYSKTQLVFGKEVYNRR